MRLDESGREGKSERGSSAPLLLRLGVVRGEGGREGGVHLDPWCCCCCCCSWGWWEGREEHTWTPGVAVVVVAAAVGDEIRGEWRREGVAHCCSCSCSWGWGWSGMGKREKHGTAIVVAAAVVGGEVEGECGREGAILCRCCCCCCCCQQEGGVRTIDALVFRPNLHLSMCPWLHAEEHVAINMVDNEILTLVCRIGTQQSASNEGLERDGDWICPGDGFDTSKSQVLVNPARTTNNTSGIRLNKGKLEGPNIQKFAFEHQYQPNEDRPVCCKLYKCAVEARMPMKWGIGLEMVGWLLPVDRVLIIDPEIMMFVYLNETQVNCNVEADRETMNLPGNQLGEQSTSLARICKLAMMCWRSRQVFCGNPEMLDLWGPAHSWVLEYWQDVEGIQASHAHQRW